MSPNTAAAGVRCCLAGRGLGPNTFVQPGDRPVPGTIRSRLVTSGLSLMQSDIDAQLSNFFEDTPPAEFDVVLRGYDRHQVDEHIKQLDNEVRQAREQQQGMQRELSDAH